jgi:hypothetical protein
MRYLPAVLTLIGLTAGGCTAENVISPNDPGYARSGAPRAGEPAPSPGNFYGRVQGKDSSGSE